MTFWITAWCTNRLSSLTADDLQRAVGINDFAMMAENMDLTEEEGYAAEKVLQFEPTSGGFRLHYRPDDPDGWIGIYRVTGAVAQEYGQEVLEEILDGSEPTRVREVVSTVEDHISFALKGDDQTSMGFPIAWYTAMWLAEQGIGLVRVGRDEWWDPADYGRPLFCQRQVAR
jgi:hypothetical protein